MKIPLGPKCVLISKFFLFRGRIIHKKQDRSSVLINQGVLILVVESNVDIATREFIHSFIEHFATTLSTLVLPSNPGMQVSCNYIELAMQCACCDTEMKC